MTTEKRNTSEEAQLGLESVKILSPGALPIALKLCEIGKIRESISALLPWDSSKAKVEPGVLGEILVASLLCGERPLYRIEELWTHHGFPHYLEKYGLVASQLNDDAFGHLLDRIAEQDGQKIVEAVAMEFLSAHALGYIFLLVLLVAKYLEHRVRLGLKQRNKSLIRGGKKMLNPSTKSILDYLKALTVLQLGNQYRVTNTNENALLIMEALGFAWTLYTLGNCEDTFLQG